MGFTSLYFFLALAVLGFIFYRLSGRSRVLFLLISSLGFYALAQPYYLILLILAAALIYWCAIKISASEVEKVKKLFLGLGLSAIILMIIVFKLAGLFHGFLLPLGISYYSFKLISYLIEVYWDDEIVEKDFLIFLTYPAFFPQIVSGPIQRSIDYFAQLRQIIEKPTVDVAQIESGFRLILGGLMLKLIIGDRIAAFINAVDASPEQFSWGILCITSFCYTLQVYTDFAGYTNIALGIGKIFGINGPPNFKAPFAAPNVQIMWQNWHMSLTSWLTDYLFMPLNMALRRWRKLGLAVAITLNMAIIGVWHGFTLNYLVYGLLHASFIITTVFTKSLRDLIFGTSVWLNRCRIMLGIISTFCLMSFAHVFFYNGTWSAALLHLRLLTGLEQTGGKGLLFIKADTWAPTFVCLPIAFYIGSGMPGINSLRRIVDAHIPNWVQYGICLLLLSILSIDINANFIYGQF